MNRANRIRKLTHAIKDYRGSYVPGSNPRRWIRTPQPDARKRVLKWLEALGVADPLEALRTIDGFESLTQMQAWLSSLSISSPSSEAAKTDMK